jgi:putative transposase
MPRPIDAPPDFQCLRDDLPIHRYTRNLPHWRQEGATYFVTFNLNDALPAQAKHALRQQRRSLAMDAQRLDDETLLKRARRIARVEEQWLERGFGACPFAQPAARDILQDTIAFFDRSYANPRTLPRYLLGAWVIMPNHMHVLIKPLDGETHPLERILQGWKSRSSRLMNKKAGKTGSIWFEESYDRIVRDSKHLWRCLQYIGNNSVVAGLCDDSFTRWVNPAWKEIGWGFES